MRQLYDVPNLDNPTPEALAFYGCEPDDELAKFIYCINSMEYKPRASYPYAAVEHMGHMADFCVKASQFAASAYREIGQRVLSIPFPGQLRGIPAPAIVETVEVVLQIRDTSGMDEHAMYLRVQYCNDTETIYTMDIGAPLTTSSFRGATVEPITTTVFEQILEHEDEIFRAFTQRIRRVIGTRDWAPEYVDTTQQGDFERALNRRADERLNSNIYISW